MFHFIVFFQCFPRLFFNLIIQFTILGGGREVSIYSGTHYQVYPLRSLLENNKFLSSISFCLFIQLMGFSRQEYWSGLPFPPPVGHVLSELFTMTCPSSVSHSFIELHKPLHHDKAVIHEEGCKQLTHWKRPDAGKDWRQKEKRATENEMVGWHHQFNRHEPRQTLRDGEGQGGLMCCSPWGHKESDTA